MLRLNRSLVLRFVINKTFSTCPIRAMTTKLQSISYLNQKDAQDFDNSLFYEYQYSTDQLMEIAGLCCAQALAQCYPIEGTGSPQVLIVCGPGNNGGDGLAAARHLLAFGYTPEIFCPKRTDKPIYQILTAQCKKLHIPFMQQLPTPSEIDTRYLVILDAIFGFSFKGNIRPPFDTIIETLKLCKSPICSVDIPSGWDVEKGNIDGKGLDPKVLVSLTCPKMCAQSFNGRHFLGLRVIPTELAKKFNLTLPVYPGSDQIVEL